MARCRGRGIRAGGHGRGDGPSTFQPSSSAGGRGRGDGPSTFQPSSSATLRPPIHRPSHLEDIADFTGATSGTTPRDLAQHGDKSSSRDPTTSTSVGTVPSTDNELLTIHVEKGCLIPGNKCSRHITKIIQQLIHPDGYAWKKLSTAHKEKYFAEFKKYCRWDEAIDGLVYDAFMDKASTRYSNLIHKFKKKRHLVRPDCVPEDGWRRWLEYWNMPDVMAKSDQQRQNRMSELGGLGTGCSRHTGGSRSIIEHSHALEKQYGRPPTAYEIFAHTHTKKDGQFVDVRSKNVADEVQARVVAATQAVEESSDLPPVDVSQLYVEVVGGVKKQRIYGLGPMAPSFMPPAHRSTTLRVDPDIIKRQVSEELHEQFEQRYQDIEARVEARMEARLRDQLSSILAEMQRTGHVPPFVQPSSRPDDIAS